MMTASLRRLAHFALGLASWHMSACQNVNEALPAQSKSATQFGVGLMQEALLRASHRPVARQPCASNIPPKYRAFADAVEAERAQLGVPGVALALIEHGEVSFAHGFGTKGLGSTEAVDENTLFRIGSMTKALTATALLSAADEHGVSLSMPVARLLPEVQLDDPLYRELTLDQVLSHQSGIVDFLTLDGPHDDASLRGYLSSADFKAAAYFMVPPGTFYDYSNPNYMLAGLALEHIGGDDYRDAVRRRVFEPLGMTRTYFLPSEVLADGNFTAGTSADARVEVDSYDNAWARPAGYAFSSVVDYARFVGFLLAGDSAVLSPSKHEALLKPRVNTDEFGPYVNYAYGLVVGTGFLLGNDFYRAPIVQHDGEIEGFESVFMFLPESNFGVVMFVNSDRALLSNSLQQAIQQFGEIPAPSPAPDDLRPDSTRFPQYAGTYEDPEVAGRVVVTAQSDQVQVSSSGADAAGIHYDPMLQPTTADNFLITIEGTPLPATFLRDQTGAYVWLRTREFVAKRVQ